MTEDPQRQALPRKPGFLDLTSLLDALRSLYSQVTSRLWQSRLDLPDTRPGSAREVAIAERMRDHLERTAAEALEKQARYGEESRQDAEVAVADPASAADPEATSKEAPSSGVSTANLRGRVQPMDPRMSEQLQESTKGHINRALRLARRGDAAGAKVHAQLAESAMKTAGEYMSEEEFAAFRTGVEQRLANLIRDL